MEPVSDVEGEAVVDVGLSRGIGDDDLVMSPIPLSDASAFDFGPGFPCFDFEEEAEGEEAKNGEALAPRSYTSAEALYACWRFSSSLERTKSVGGACNCSYSTSFYVVKCSMIGMKPPPFLAVYLEPESDSLADLLVRAGARVGARCVEEIPCPTSMRVCAVCPGWCRGSTVPTLPNEPVNSDLSHLLRLALEGGDEDDGPVAAFEEVEEKSKPARYLRRCSGDGYSSVILAGMVTNRLAEDGICHVHEDARVLPYGGILTTDPKYVHSCVVARHWCERGTPGDPFHRFFF